MWKQVQRIYNGIQRLKYYSTEAFIDKYHQKARIQLKICNYFEKLNFKIPKIEVDEGNPNFLMKLNLITDAAKHCPTYEPDVSLSLLQYYSKCSSFYFNKTFEPNFCRKLSNGITVMNIEEMYLAARSLSKIIAQKSRYNNLNEVRISILKNCEANICESSPENSLKFMCISYMLLGGVLSNKKVYSNFIKTDMKFDSLTVSQLIQTIHYVGLSKTRNKGNVAHCAFSYLMEKLDSSMDISQIDLGIVCAGLSKHNYLVKSIFKENLVKFMQAAMRKENVVWNEFDKYAFHSIAHLIFSSYCFDKVFLQDIKNFVMKDENNFPTIISSLLMYCTKSNYIDEELLNWYEEYIIKNLLHDQNIIDDLNRAMLVFLLLKGKCSERLTMAVCDYMKYFYMKPASYLVNINLHNFLFKLIILDIVPEQACKIVFSEEYINILTDENPRSLLKIQTMHEAVRHRVNIDLPYSAKIYNQFTKKRIKMNNRYKFQAIGKAIYWLNRQLDGHSPLRLGELVNGIEYISLVIDSSIPFIPNSTSVEKIGTILQQLDGAKVCVDINDQETSLMDESRPNGMEHWKRKVLEKRGWQVCVLKQKDIPTTDYQTLLLAILESVRDSYVQTKQ